MPYCMQAAAIVLPLGKALPSGRRKQRGLLHLVLALASARRLRRMIRLLWRAGTWLLLGKLLTLAAARPGKTLLLAWLGAELWFR